MRTLEGVANLPNTYSGQFCNSQWTGSGLLTSWDLDQMFGQKLDKNLDAFETRLFTRCAAGSIEAPESCGGPVIERLLFARDGVTASYIARVK